MNIDDIDDDNEIRTNLRVASRYDRNAARLRFEDITSHISNRRQHDIRANAMLAIALVEASALVAIAIMLVSR